MDLLLKNCTLYDEIVNIGISAGFISYIGKDKLSAAEAIDLRGKIVMPGMIDPHVHMRDLGQADKEDWESGTKAALSGGVTTVCDMPNSIPPTVSTTNFEQKRRVAEKSLINYSYHAGTKYNSNTDLKELLKEHADKLAGIKIYLAATSSNEVLDREDLLKEVFTLAEEYDKPVLFHTEMQSILQEYQKRYEEERYNDVAYHDSIRHRECEIEGTKLLLKMAARTSARIYLCHVSVKEVYELVEEYRRTNDNVYVEVTPHHTLLNFDQVYVSGNFAKINPPLRSEADRSYLYGKMIAGAVDAIGSDHAPHSRDSKLLPYKKAPSGFPGLETSYPLLIDQALRGFISFEKLADLVAGKAAAFFKLKKRGVIAEGMHADLVVIDPKDSWLIRPSRFYSKAKFSPYSGKHLKGKIVKTLVNGVVVYSGGIFTEKRVGMEIEYD